MSAASKVSPAACSLPALEPAEVPSALERALVALVALAALVWPYLWDRQSGSADAVGVALAHDGLRLITGHEVLSQIPAQPSRLLDTLTTSWWGRLDPGQALYRPLSSFVLGLGALIAGEPYDPAAPGMGAVPFKLFSIALKVISALLLVELASWVLRRRRYALIAGLLFAALPVHGEALFDVVGVAELLATAFSLGALILWVRLGDRPFSDPVKLTGAALLTLLASLSKESAFVLPLVAFCLDLALARDGGFGAGLSAALRKLPAQAALLLALALSLALRFAVLGSLSPDYPAETALVNPLVFEDFGTRFMNAARVLASSLPLLIGLNRLSGNWDYSADYSASQIPVLPAFALPNLIGLALLALALAAPLLLFRRCRTRAALFLALLASTLLTSNLLFPIGTLFGERLLFFPSAFAVLFLAPFLGRLGRAGVALALALSLGGVYWTIQRAGHWLDPMSLWSYTANKSSPNSALAQFNLGIANLQKESRGFAELYFQKATEKYPGYADSWAALASVRADDPSGSASALKKALDVRLEQAGYRYQPGAALAPTSIPVLLEGLTQLQAINPRLDPEGHLEFLEGLEARGYQSPYVALRRAETLRALGRLEEADQAYARGLEIEVTPSGVGAYARFLRLSGRDDEAAALFQRHLALLEAETAKSGSDTLLRIEYLLGRGDAELAKEPAKALASAESALALSPTGETLLRGLLLRSQARLDLPAQDAVEMAQRISGVVEDLRRGLQAHPYDSRETRAAASILARLLPSQGNKEAISLLSGLVAGQQDTPTLRLSLGQVLMRDGRFQEAATQFELSAQGLLRKAGDPLSDEAYIQARTGELFALRAAATPEATGQLEARLGEEAARQTPQAEAVRANFLAATGDFPGARAALEALRSRVAAPAQVQPFVQRIERLEALAALPKPSPAELAEQASLRLSILDTRGAAELAQGAAQAAAQAPVELRAQVLLLWSQCLEAASGPEAALAPLEEAGALPGLAPQLAGSIDQARRRLQALLGKA